jgi:excisionase family DNA binding protein
LKRLDLRGNAAASGVSTTAILPVLWTSRETADYLGISEKKLEMDRWRGPTIPFVKVGRHVRYRAGDVLDYLEANVHRAAG